MMAGFGTISLSVLFFFFLYRLQGIGNVISQLSTILAPFIYGGIIAYLLRPMCNSLEAFFQLRLPQKMRQPRKFIFPDYRSRSSGSPNIRIRRKIYLFSFFPPYLR